MAHEELFQVCMLVALCSNVVINKLSVIKFSGISLPCVIHVHLQEKQLKMCLEP